MKEKQNKTKQNKTQQKQNETKHYTTINQINMLTQLGLSGLLFMPKRKHKKHLC